MASTLAPHGSPRLRRADRRSSGVFSGEEWTDGGASSSSSAAGSDSAYGTLDEGSSSEGHLGSRRRESSKRRLRVRSSSVGQLRDTDSDSLLDSGSDVSPPATPSVDPPVLGSAFELEPSQEWDSRSPTRKLARRHTVPPRRRPRTTSLSLLAPPSTLVPTLPPPPLALVPPRTPLAHIAAVISLALSTLALVAPVPLLAASPVHLLHPRSHLLLEATNALLSPFLIAPTASSIALGTVNLLSLRSIEADPRLGPRSKFVLVTAIWTVTVCVRVAMAWIFGRGVGWAYPELFFNDAVHEVGAGLAPLLLACLTISSLRSSNPSPLLVASVSMNFATPLARGGTGFWWGASAIVSALAACAVLELWGVATAPRASPKIKSPPSRLIPLFALLALPWMALSRMGDLTPASTIATSFLNLHPQQPTLLTVLLMTAPRPGDPDFLVQTIESWLGAMPDPTVSQVPSSTLALRAPLDVSDRVRLIVYTHFETHALFDAARAFFSASPLYAAKAERYVDWRRDPRATSNRLDQRLHVARGLEYSTRSPSAYVLLAEDDFPLCPDGAVDGSKSWKKTWVELMRVLVATNVAMPDPTDDAGVEERRAGHCGVFIATGGSGLAMRGFIAGRLPALLLGASDPHGVAREARAARGEFLVKREDEGADTPDLVIQDCLRGKIAGCEVCAPPLPILLASTTHPSTYRFPAGSARNPFSVAGDRWGKSGLAATATLMQHHLGFNASTLPGRSYGKEEWSCRWRSHFNGDPDVLIV